MPKYTLVYDGDCSSCSNFKRILDVLDKSERLEFETLTEAEEGAVLDSIPMTRRNSSFHLVSPKGSVQSGSDAMPELAGLFPFGSLTSFLIRSTPIGRAVDFVYSLFVRLHDSGSCRSGLH